MRPDGRAVGHTTREMPMRRMHVSMIILTALGFSAPVPLAHATHGESGSAQVESPYTPARGSSERKAILDALRAEMRRFDARPVVFVVQHLKVQRGWAWLQVDPQSPDGKSRYEREPALLRRTAGQWQVVERMPALSEREGGALQDDCAYFRHLRGRFPSLPVSILPGGRAAGCRPRPRG